MKKKSLNKKKDLVIGSLLERLTDFQLQSNDEHLFEYCEALRQCISDFSEGIICFDMCQKCGCSEFLCGHNKKA